LYRFGRNEKINFIEKIISQFFCNYKKWITFALISEESMNKDAAAFFIGTDLNYRFSNDCCAFCSVIDSSKSEDDSFLF
jgi:hypothetical protein